MPREMLVHDLEHGAVLMLYDCDTDCPDVVAAFEQVRADFPADTTCGGGPSRFVIAPDPALDEPIGLAAWGAIYVATCVDPDSLAAFAAARYGHGPEQMCGQGDDPATVDCAE